jgi:hypothetical protein
MWNSHSKLNCIAACIQVSPPTPFLPSGAMLTHVVSPCAPCHVMSCCAVQANKAGADEALMLDPHGFVATCNSTNFFIVRQGEVWAPTTKYQLHGITRENVLTLCHQHGIPCVEKDFSLTQVWRLVGGPVL